MGKFDSLKPKAVPIKKQPLLHIKPPPKIENGFTRYREVINPTSGHVVHLPRGKR